MFKLERLEIIAEYLKDEINDIKGQQGVKNYLQNMLKEINEEIRITKDYRPLACE